MITHECRPTAKVGHGQESPTWNFVYALSLFSSFIAWEGIGIAGSRRKAAALAFGESTYDLDALDGRAVHEEAAEAWTSLLSVLLQEAFKGGLQPLPRHHSLSTLRISSTSTLQRRSLVGLLFGSWHILVVCIILVAEASCFNMTIWLLIKK